MIVDIFDLAPAELFADVRTTTDVIGNPPIRALIILPTPCALSSTLVSVYLFGASMRAAASIQSNLSLDATTAMVAPTLQTLWPVNASKSGNTIILEKSANVSGIGNETRCSCIM